MTNPFAALKRQDHRWYRCRRGRCAANKKAASLAAKKVKEGYIETTKAAPTAPVAPIAMERHPQVVALIDELRALGATVEVAATPYTTERIRAAEMRLGFGPPTEYAEFLLQFGSLRIEPPGLSACVFYGVDESPDDLYSDEFSQHYIDDDDEESEGYWPRRFVVLLDDGASEEARGLIYDADLEAMMFTAGFRPISSDEALKIGYWTRLLEELRSVRDELRK